MMRFISRSISGPTCEGGDTAELLACPVLAWHAASPDFVRWSYGENGPTQWVLVANYTKYAAAIGFLDQKPDLPLHAPDSYGEPML